MLLDLLFDKLNCIIKELYYSIFPKETKYTRYFELMDEWKSELMGQEDDNKKE